MDEFREELYENTMLESEKDYKEYAKIYSDFKDEIYAVLSVENVDIRAKLLVNLQRKYINNFVKANEIGDNALIDTYKDILVELGSDDYILDDYKEDNMGIKK